jgi:hypothetical protein
VPRIGLRRTVAEARERLQDDVGADGVRGTPARGRVQPSLAVAVDVDDEAAVDLQVRGLRRVRVADVLEVGADLLDARIAVALRS